MELLADCPELIPVVGEMRSREWGRAGTRPALVVGDVTGRVWVAAGDQAVGFYERCGWHVTETFGRASGELVTVLSLGSVL